MVTILVQIKQFVLFALQEALVSIKKAPLHVHKELILKKASSIARSVKPDWHAMTKETLNTALRVSTPMTEFVHRAQRIITVLVTPLLNLSVLWVWFRELQNPIVYSALLVSIVNQPLLLDRTVLQDTIARKDHTFLPQTPDCYLRYCAADSL